MPTLNAIKTREAFETAVALGIEKRSTFFNPRQAYTGALHERPEHRMMILLRAKGLSVSEIAQALGYSIQRVQDVLNQPWALSRLESIITEVGIEDVRSMVASACPEAVLTLIQLHKDPEQPGTVRRSAAAELLNKYLPSPKTEVQLTVDNAAHLSDAELAQIAGRGVESSCAIVVPASVPPPTPAQPLDKDLAELLS